MLTLAFPQLFEVALAGQQTRARSWEECTYFGCPEQGEHQVRLQQGSISNIAKQGIVAWRNSRQCLSTLELE